MPRTVSATALQAMLAQQTSEVFLPFLKIEHPSITTIYIVYNTDPITRTEGVYQPYAFHIALPEDVEDKIPQVQVTIDNTDLTINDTIRGLVGVPTITFFVALASSPNTIEAGTYVYSLQSITADANTITGTLGFESDVFAQQVPGITYVPVNSAGLFT
jgi:hypothetical protein